ncbi:response regulator [Thermophagus sp. OGC60D27]|uniref:response regulator n=1 Tax=Thermophagus sp. OGC60D27 TaxID=3458415 RepID=UPI00403791B9
MINPLKNHITLIALFIRLLSLSGQDSISTLNLYEANHIDLSNKAVLSLYQDNNGYLWIGTYDGLNLFNGKDVFVYRFDFQAKESLSSNIIHKITPAEKGQLWVSTFLGLNKFSTTDRIVTESYPECPEAKLLAADPLGNTCVITENESIKFYNPINKHFQTLPLKGIFKDQVKVLFSVGENKFVLVLTDGSFFTLQFSNTNTQPIVNKSPKFKHPNSIVSAFCDRHSIFWIDSNGGLYKQSIKNNQSIFLQDIRGVIHKYGEISQIVSFQNDIYLAFKTNGVIRLNRHYNFQPENINLKTGVFSLLPDYRQKILWIGTDGQGIRMYFNKPNQFNSISLDQLPFNLQKPVRSILTANNDLWIGTKGDGIIRIQDYEHPTNKIEGFSKTISYTTREGLSNNQVFAFKKSDFHNLIWIGTEGPGLSYYSFDSNAIITPQGLNKNIEKVHAICETDDSTLWVATAGAGLLKVRYRTTKEQLEINSVEVFTFEKSGRICNEFHAISIIGKSTLLIGSRGGYGLIRLNTQTHKHSFIPMNGTGYSPIGDVLSVHQSKDSVFYVGASSGLTKLQLRPNQSLLLKQFDRRDGLTNDMIHGILEDRDGCIWLSTNKGLAKYNPRNDFFHNYTKDLEVTEFSDDAYWKCPSTGRLFFGGINGLVWFDPKLVNTPNNQPKFSFFELKFSGNAVPWSRYFDPRTRQLDIPPHAKSFSISFVAVDHYSPDNYEYSYLLQGFNHDWVKLQKNNEASFSGLPIGHYTLIVKFNNDVFDSENNTYRIKIHVMPPWYLSSGMILFYLFLSFSFFIYLIFYFRNKIQKKHLSLTKKIEEEQRENLLETKLNFFTNITHELCTPLTLINGVTDQIRKEKNHQKIKEFTDVLLRNVNNLNELIQEILDFRKIEDTQFGMCRIEKNSISNLIAEVKASFNNLALQNKITFNVSYPEKLYWNTDYTFLKKIIINLTSNAFKYSNIQGRVEIDVAIINNQLKIRVFNTGPGIPEADIPHLFRRFGIVNNLGDKTNIPAASRTGLGLSICKGLVNTLKGSIEVNSEEGHYAEFIVWLPKLKSEEGKIYANNSSKKHIEPELQPIDQTISKPGILVVDDNNDITWLIAQTLNPDFQIREASCSTDALELIKEASPDLIITDIIMPGMSGLEFIQQIKGNPYTKQIPVIVVSAKITHSEQAEGFKIGADAYLTKPFSPQLLRSVVNRLIHNRQEMKDFYQSSDSAFEYSDGLLIHEEDKVLLNKVMTIIKENIENEKLRPAFLADQLGMNVRSFYRRFKNISVLSPSDFIKDFRLNYAARLLLTSKLTVQEIIYKVGITNKSYFYREFAKKFNMTPREYRNKEQNKTKK